MIERLDPPAAAEREAIAALARRNGLPTDGLNDSPIVAVVARWNGTIIGSAALELYGDAALLRSVAVDASARGQGWGQRLTQAALDLARDCGVRRVFLLTETADAFFPRFGFRRIARGDVDPAVHASVEWTSACPASARAMMIDLA